MVLIFIHSTTRKPEQYKTNNKLQTTSTQLSINQRVQRMC